MDRREAERAHPRLGEILASLGAVTREQLDEAAVRAREERTTVAQALLAGGLVGEEDLDKAVSERLGVPYFTTFEGLLDPEAARLIPEAAARKLMLAPILLDGKSLVAGMTDPSDTDAIDEAALLSGMHVQPVMTTPESLFDALARAYGGERAPASAVDSVSGVIDGLLQEGLARRASDIHIEAAEKHVRVRFRVDGILLDGKTFSKETEAALAARVKILARLDITETRLPQDGRIRFTSGGRGVDVRVSTLPTVHGEKIVMRLLDASKSLRRVQELGVEDAILRRFVEAVRGVNGLILVTGPTGSGKTTTLYAALAELNGTDRNIVTLEDPVEYVIDRVNQMEAFSKIGLNFAKGLRAILRQDPDVILVGEIRDLETAEIALQASITGHLVFSTLHTNDAPSSVHRLFNMKVEPFMVTAALRGVLAQRLLRRLCEKCRRPVSYPPERLREVGVAPDGRETWFEPGGCPACLGTGYQGRFAIHEWLPVNRAVREMILRRAGADELRAAMAAEGLRTMRQSALERAASGETSLEDVLRVTREQVEG